MRNDPVQTALARLDDLALDSEEGRAQILKALKAKSNLVCAKAARIIGDAQLIQFRQELADAFTRLLNAGAEADKGCAAKVSIARALNKLEYDDAELFLAGMKCRQLEPVWGGSEDRAADLRAICAMGLAGSTYYFKLREFVDLLGDQEWPARAGAVRALAAVGSEAASLLLRFKAITGDAEVEVISDCFAGLLELNGAEAVPLVARFAAYKPDRRTARGGDPVREAAILALGASRLPDAVEMLKQMFGVTADPDGIRCILLSLATARTEEANAFLLGVVREGGTQASAIAAEALELSPGAELKARLDEALRTRAT